MTLPSDVLDAIARGLGEAFTRDDKPSIYTAVIDDVTLGELVQYVTVPSPALLISSLAMVHVPEMPGLVDMHFIARCLARASEKSDAPTAEVRSRGDVAANLAGLVVCRLDNAAPWLDEAGKELAVTRPIKIQARNLGARTLTERGASMWVVSWQQQFEIAPEDIAVLLHRFRQFKATLVMGDEHMPDVSAQLELEGTTP